MDNFTPTQGRYLAFIHTYIGLHGYPPAESELAAAMCVSPPSVNQMVKMLEKKGLILRRPGQARSIEILISEDQIPPWGNRKPAKKSSIDQRDSPSKAISSLPSAKLYVFTVFLTNGPVDEKFANRETSRTIEIRGDQTLGDLHKIIFTAFERDDEHLYEFQFGKRPFDPKGPDYGIAEYEFGSRKRYGDARTTTIDELKLKKDRSFGYWFDFGDDWFHEIQVDRIEDAIPTVTYPRVIKKVGKSPPQYLKE